MQIYILSYSRLRKKEPLIAPGSHQGGGGLTSASAVPHCGTWYQNMSFWTTMLVLDHGAMVPLYLSLELSRRVLGAPSMTSQPAALHLCLSATALCDSGRFSPVRSLTFSSHRFLCLPLLIVHLTAPCKTVFLPGRMIGRHARTTSF